MKWANQILTWQAHCQRNINQTSWVTAIQRTRPDSWLREQRSTFVPIKTNNINAFTSAAGRLGTRDKVGRPSTRWESGLLEVFEVSGAARKTRPTVRRTEKPKYQRIVVKTFNAEMLNNLDAIDLAKDFNSVYEPGQDVDRNVDAGYA